MYLIIQVMYKRWYIYYIDMGTSGVMGTITAQQATTDLGLNHSKAAHQGKRNPSRHLRFPFDHLEVKFKEKEKNT